MGYHIDIYEVKRMLFEDYMRDYTLEEAVNYYGYPCSALSFENSEEERFFYKKTHRAESAGEYFGRYEAKEMLFGDCPYFILYFESSEEEKIFREKMHRAELSGEYFGRYDSKRIADTYEHNKDYALALKWYKIAAHKGSKDAKYKVGEYYEKGIGVTADIYVAYKWYVDAAEDGYVDARRKLAPEYYRGTEHCRKDRKRAKSYWISYLIEYPYECNTKELNRYFPGWKKESDDAFDKLCYSCKHTVKELADLAIGAAAYYMGEHLSDRIPFNSNLGYSKDNDEARRWYLKAVLLGYTDAERTLRKYYSIDVYEAYTANAMFQLGVKYWNDKSEKGKDLTFFWCYRAVENGYEDGCNNLGVCYYKGVGVEQNHEEANKLYIRAIKYNNNPVALYNYGASLYYGYGVEEDKAKAKEYLIKARDQGYHKAKEFLKNAYRINIDFNDITDMEIYSNSNVNVEFCGMYTSKDGFELQFWISNSSSRQYNFWAKGVTQNEEEIKAFSNICECKAGKSDFYKVFFDSQIAANDSIRFSVEIDDIDDEEICTTTNVEVKIGTNDHQVSAKLMGVMLSPPLEICDPLYTAGSYYKINSEHNGVEIYFLSKPREDIIDELKANHWRWYKSKRCWYIYDTQINRDLAERITGNNQR